MCSFLSLDSNTNNLSFFIVDHIYINERNGFRANGALSCAYTVLECWRDFFAARRQGEAPTPYSDISDHCLERRWWKRSDSPVLERPPKREEVGWALSTEHYSQCWRDHSSERSWRRGRMTEGSHIKHRFHD